MRLLVGILGNSAGWETLLQQEGVPHAYVNEALTPEHYSVVVAGNETDDRETEMLRQYLSLGGAVLCTTKVYAAIRSTTFDRTSVYYVYPGSGSAFEGVGVVDVYSVCHIPWNANDLMTSAGSLGAHVGPHELGHLVSLPFDPSALVLDTRTSLKSFPSRARRLPFERVSTVAKGGLRKLVAQALELLHRRRGLPYVHQWYVPRDHPTIFSFRVDTDFASDDQVEALFRLARSHDIPATWFVDVESQKGHLGKFQRMLGHEIGSHGFGHRRYDDVEDAKQDIRRADQELAAAGIHAEGYAAPYGQWNDDVRRAVQDRGFAYSSEFSYDYDSLPSFPRAVETWSGVLQVPVHPVSIGSLRRQGSTDEEVAQYMEGVLSAGVAAREPVLIFYHPQDGHLGALERLFRLVRAHKIPAMTMGQYASWWRQRLASTPQLWVDDGHLRVKSSSKESDVWLSIRNVDGTECIVPSGESMNLAQLPWRPQPPTPALPPDWKRARRFNYRIPLTIASDAVGRFLPWIRHSHVAEKE